MTLTDDLKKKLKSEITYINTHARGLNFQIVFDDEDPFRGLTRSYGMFRGIRNYVAMIADAHFDGFEERCGYYGEQFVMKCVEEGLGTCFVGATFSNDKVMQAVNMRVYEKLVCLITFGIPELEKTSFIGRLAAKMTHRKSLRPEQFYSASDGMTLEEALKREPQLAIGLDAIACAPSAVNKQPVRIAMNSEGKLRMFTAFDSRYTKIDLGIAEFNFDAVAPGLLELENI